MNRFLPPSGSLMPPGPEWERRIPGRALFWKFQSYILVGIACTSFFPILFRYQEHAVIILIVLCVGMCAVEKASPWIRSPVDLPLWLFIAWVLVTVPFATDAAYSFAEWKKFVAQAGVFYWSLLVLRRCRQENLPQQILLSLAVGGTLVAAYALIDFVGRGGTWKDRVIRANAFGSDYNWLSTYMVMTIPVIGSLIVMGRVAWLRITQLLAFALAFAAQMFSYTRGGWLGHAVQAVTLALIIGGRRLATAVLGVLVLVGAGLFIASQTGFQKETVGANTANTRLAVWTIGLRELMAHPLVGIGYGNDSFVKRFPEYSVQVQAHIPERERVIPAMHNAFLMVALGSGLPALVCFTWMFVSLLRQLLSTALLDEKQNFPKVMAVGIGLAVLGFGIRNLFDYMFTGSLAHVFWLLAAVGVTVTADEIERNRREQDKAMRLDGDPAKTLSRLQDAGSKRV